MAERLDLPCATRSTICIVPRAQNSIKHAPTTYVYASLHYVPALRDRAAVARRAHNPEVVGSNPTPATIPITNGRCLAASAVCRVPFPRFPLRGGSCHEGAEEGVGARAPIREASLVGPPLACGSPPPPARACLRGLLLSADSQSPLHAGPGSGARLIWWWCFRCRWSGSPPVAWTGSSDF